MYETAVIYFSLWKKKRGIRLDFYKSKDWLERMKSDVRKEEGGGSFTYSLSLVGGNTSSGYSNRDNMHDHFTNREPALGVEPTVMHIVWNSFITSSNRSCGSFSCHLFRSTYFRRVTCTIR